MHDDFRQSISRVLYYTDEVTVLAASCCRISCHAESLGKSKIGTPRLKRLKDLLNIRLQSLEEGKHVQHSTKNGQRSDQFSHTISA